MPKQRQPVNGRFVPDFLPVCGLGWSMLPWQLPKTYSQTKKLKKPSVGDNSFSFSSSSQSRHHPRTQVLSVYKCREHKRILIPVKRHSGVLGSNLNLLFKPKKAFWAGNSAVHHSCDGRGSSLKTWISFPFCSYNSKPHYVQNERWWEIQ